MAILAALIPTQAVAQIAVTGSELAGVTFPVASNLWVPDASRSQAAALDDASALAERACGATEFHIWDAIGGDRDIVRARVDTAFAEAGWSLGVITLAPNGERVYLATRRDEELVMAWLPRSEAIGLVLCRVTGPRTEAANVADPAAQITPLPRPRPDPNAAILPSPEPEPEPAEEPAPDLDAIAQAIDSRELQPVDPNEGAVGGIAGPVAPDAAASGEAEAEPAADPAAADGSSDFSIWLLVVAVVLAAGAGALFWWSRVSAKAIAGASWVPTVATVVFSDVATEEDKDVNGRDTTRYVPVVAYEYEVDGETYQAARLRFGDSSRASLDEAKKLAERFPVGAGIEVLYDPKTPSEATIEADPDRIEFRIIAGIALAVLAVAALISAMG